MIDVYDCGIDGVMPYIHLKLIDECLIADKPIYEDDYEHMGFAVVARQPYNKSLLFTLFGKYLKYDEANANCYILKTESYPRSNPKKISLIYMVHPLRQISEGLLLFAKPYTFVELIDNKTASNSLKLQPDYCGGFTTLDKMKLISKLLYLLSNMVAEIVELLYNKQVKNASLYI